MQLKNQEVVMEPSHSVKYIPAFGLHAACPLPQT